MWACPLSPLEGLAGKPPGSCSSQQSLTHTSHLVDIHCTHFTSTSQVRLSFAQPVWSCMGRYPHVDTHTTHTHGICTSSHHPLPHFLQVLLTHISSFTLFTGAHDHSPTCIHHIYKHHTPSYLPPCTDIDTSRSPRCPVPGAPHSCACMPSHLHMLKCTHIRGHMCSLHPDN